VTYCCECHGHSDWSLLDGVGPRELHAERAAEAGHIALAMTEHAVLSGTVHHIDACNRVGILPITGLEAYYRRRRISNVEIESMRKRKIDVEEFGPYFHMVLIAKNVRGWRTLKLLSSESYRSGFYKKPCIDDELLVKHHEDILISTSCISGYVPKAILRDDDAAVKQHCDMLDRLVGDDWYFELQPHGFEDLVIVNRAIPDLAAVYGKPIVAARDAHAPDKTWVETQHVSIAIRTKGSMVADNRNEAEADEKYDMTIADTAIIADAATTFADFQRFHPGLDPRVVEQAMDNTGWVVDQCAPWMMDSSPKLPRYKNTRDEEYEELRRRVYAGLAAKGKGGQQNWIDAVEKELKIYRERQVCAFFLITGDMISWLRSKDGLPPCEWDPNPVPSKTPEKVGLGRGSAGGCRVAYALGIVLVNPEAYEHSFERFLNPNRKGLPDIDIDLTEEGERLAKEWLKRTRGQDKVYDMIAHGTLAARGAIKRVGRVYGLTEQQLNVVTKNIPDDESNEKLQTLRAHLPELDNYALDNPKAWEHAVRLQGSRVTQSEHASAVIISDIPLEQLMPVMKKSAKDDYLVTAFGDAADKTIASNLGFLKLDLLRVTQLAKQAYAERLIREVNGIDVDLDKIAALEDPRDVDAKAMNIYALGLKLGLFQWDGKSNMASLTKQIMAALSKSGQHPSIYHLAAANAGVRPGVAQHVNTYVERVGGAHFEYWDPSIEPALRETFGLPLFQEQVMTIFELIGGYSAAEADDVRRIMAKEYRKKGGAARELLETYEDRFVANASSVCSGGRAVAQMIWDFCGNACEYLFNRIHANEYSLISYQDAWMKAHYPHAFYASLLTFPPAWIKKPKRNGHDPRNDFYERCVREARGLGIEIRPPDVNDSDLEFTIRGDAVLFGLKGIKGLGPAMVADVINNRPFASLEDMGVRLTACNKAGRQALGAAGALDRFGERGILTPEERATAEEERIGVALSGEDKLAGVRDELRAMIHTQDEFEAAPNGQAMVVGGEIISGREVKTRKGPSVKLTIAFGADEYLCSVPPWDWEAGTPKGDALRALVASDVPVIVRGSKDVEWSCVAVDEIRAASEVLAMMPAAA
jgi:DNA polymerase-3 subunit alpha